MSVNAEQAFRSRRAAGLRALGADEKDKSPKGFLDELAAPLCDTINANPHYFTTSSCSGRISLFLEGHADKRKNHWLLASHDKVTYGTVRELLETYVTGEAKTSEEATSIVMRFEPFIVAVECEDLSYAATLVSLAQQAGCRESGCAFGGAKRFIVSIRCALRLETPVANSTDGILVTEGYLRHLVDTCNTKFDANTVRINTLLTAVQAKLSAPVMTPSSSGKETWGIRFPSSYLKTVRDGLLTHGFIASVKTPTIRLSSPSEKPLYLALALNETGTTALKDLLSSEEIITTLGITWEPTFARKHAKPVQTYPVSTLSVQLLPQPTPAKPTTPFTVSNSSDGKTHDSSMDKHTSTSSSSSSSLSLLQKALLQVCHEQKWPISLVYDGSVPRKWEKLGNCVLLPSNAFISIAWDQIKDKSALWEGVAAALQCERVGRQEKVAQGEKRKSQVKLLRGTDGWVSHSENGIIYCLDVTRSMFSSGNVTEKKRAASFAQPGETIVDLYAGIGYFTLPFLVHGHVAKVHACEFHDFSVQALQRGFDANKIDSSRYEIHAGDNRDPALLKKITNVADRVSLGLLPTSEPGWSTALHALKPTGGWMHVHENITEGKEAEFISTMITRMQKLAQANNDIKKQQWNFRVCHVERVKSYAPRIWHLVFDVRVFIPSVYDFKNTAQAITSPVPPTSNPVRIIEKTITKNDFWNDIFPAREPVVLRGLYLGEAPIRWSPDYLQSKFKDSKKSSDDAVVSAHVAPIAAMNYVGEKNYSFEKMTLSELICRADEASQDPIQPRIYLRSMGAQANKQAANFYTSYPALASDFIVPDLTDVNNHFSTVLRVSSGGLKLWTHYDIVDNLLCHVTGTKQVTLFHPRDASNLYIPTDNHSSSSPIVDLDNVDLKKYPRYANTTRYQCTLLPGDILFIPALWFHHVTSDSFAVSVNVFFRNLAANYYQRIPKDLYGNRDLLSGVKAMDLAREAATELKNAFPETAKISAKEMNLYREFYMVRCMQQFQQ